MKLEKAKKVVLVRSKCAPARVEKAAVSLSTETKSLPIQHHSDMEQPLLVTFSVATKSKETP